MTSAAMALRQRIRSDLARAMKDARKTEAVLLRSLLAAIDNAEAPAQTAEQASALPKDFARGTAEVARLDLSPRQLAALLAAEIAERLQAAAAMESRGRSERAADLRAQAELVRRYLP